MATLGAGLYSICFFHLLAHAFFKALLFITVGAIIHISRDFQDLRKVSIILKTCPTTVAFLLSANLRLCGLPFSSGFYSKDLCIESWLYGGCTLSMRAVFLIATRLTAAYSARFIILCISTEGRSQPAIWSNDRDPLMLSAISGLFPLAIFGGRALSWGLFCSPPLSSFSMLEKNSTLLIITLGALMGAILASGAKGVKGKKIWALLLFIWAIPPISSRAPSRGSLGAGGRYRLVRDLH
jgi:NADH:ubiquinone oxidoreductase subunit 5 (subunit L)/multisubunit Na+/H+ antiporter MnhA subunit